MSPLRKSSWAPAVALGIFLFGAPAAALAQVSPAEIVSPRLKALQQTYLAQLTALNHSIGNLKFSFPFALSRYVGLDPKDQAGSDTRGLEFVNFHERILLKISGNYNAAYNADRLSQNQRADRVFHDVVAPILQLVSQGIPADAACDAVGFEISYHVRRQTRNSDYEGKEILAVVITRADAFANFRELRDNDWQEILNRSEVYLNGQQFALALGAREPLNPEALDRPAQPPSAASSIPVARDNASRGDLRWSRIRDDASSAWPNSEAQIGATAKTAPSGSIPALGGDQAQAQAPTPPAATPDDAKRLQTNYQPQLDALAKEGLEKFQFVEYSPPSFVVFQSRVVLQLTLRNPLRFEKDASSIYKRAAQSFDLFLAPQLKDILDKVPQGADFHGLDITLLNQLNSKSAPASEALEFVCPLKALRQFADAEITNQELINESVVLVNGVRIALNLQLVE